MICFAALFLAGAAVLGALNAAADVEAGEAAYAGCASCHGQQGEGNVVILLAVVFQFVATSNASATGADNERLQRMTSRLEFLGRSQADGS